MEFNSDGDIPRYVYGTEIRPVFMKSQVSSNRGKATPSIGLKFLSQTSHQKLSIKR